MNNQNIPSEWLINNDFDNQRIDYFLKKKSEFKFSECLQNN